MHQRLAQRSSTIRLADAAGFGLGPLIVDPPARAVHRDGRSEMLEPRAMQLLVCLGRRRGEVVSREALIEACWDGRIVGDDAVNRVVAQLRRLSQGLGAGAFTLETIPRVGYRLMVPVREAPPPASAAQATVAHPSAAPAGSRRALLAAGALALAGVGGGAAAILLRPSTDALAPVRLLLAGRHPQQREAEALLVGHLAGRPDDPAALGLLALAHALTATTDFMAKNQMRIEKGRAAARRALERDPANADATVALAMNRPVYRNCQAYEDAVPAAALRFPHHWLANLSLAQVRAHTGRFAEALAPAEEATIREPNSPGARYWLALVQWGAGKLPAADATQVESLQRFPFDPTLFQQRFSFLALTGRAAEARSLGSMGHLDRPDDSDLPLSPEVALPVLDALEFGGIDRRRSAVAALVAARREGRVATFEVVPWIAALGDPDTALAMLPSYYFGTGPIGSRDHDRPRPGDFRHSYFLFLPPMAAVWPVPGFSTLLAEIGLDDFWHRSATTPDFRR